LLGLVELLVNAIEHGNLAITSREKAEAMQKEGGGGYPDLLAERLADPRMAQRMVTVEFEQNALGCQWMISDEGEGFEWREFIEDISDQNVFRTNCRGVYLASLQFDDLKYLNNGNTVRVKKRSSAEKQVDEG
jgi:anti-sigma regulatory factor (Ser/Thr protein kinase)